MTKNVLEESNSHRNSENRIRESIYVGYAAAHEDISRELAIESGAAFAAGKDTEAVLLRELAKRFALKGKEYRAKQASVPGNALLR